MGMVKTLNALTTKTIAPKDIIGGIGSHLSGLPVALTAKQLGETINNLPRPLSTEEIKSTTAALLAQVHQPTSPLCIQEAVNAGIKAATITLPRPITTEDLRQNLEETINNLPIPPTAEEIKSINSALLAQVPPFVTLAEIRVIMEEVEPLLSSSQDIFARFVKTIEGRIDKMDK